MYKLNEDHEYLGFYVPEKKKNFFVESDPSTGNIMICNAKIIKLPKEIKTMSYNNLEWIRSTNSKLPRIISRGKVTERLSRIRELMQNMDDYCGGEVVIISENLHDYNVEMTRVINDESGVSYEIPESQYQVVNELWQKGFILKAIDDLFYVVNDEDECFGIIEQYKPVQMELDFGEKVEDECFGIIEQYKPVQMELDFGEKVEGFKNVCKNIPDLEKATIEMDGKTTTIFEK